MGRFRIFASENERKNLPDDIRVEESYPGFLIVSADQSAVQTLKSRFPVEELLEPVTPAMAVKPAGNRRGGRSAAPTKTLTGDIVIRFRAPVREEWLKELVQAGAEIKRPLGNLAILAAVPNAVIRAAVLNNPAVQSVDSHVPDIRLSPNFVKQLKGTADKKTVSRATMRLANERTPQQKDTYSSIPGVVVANFMTREDCAKAQQALAKKGVKEIHSAGATSLLINLHSTTDADKGLDELLAQPGLSGVEEKQIPKLHNNVARLVIGSGVVTNNASGLGLDADGEVIAVADTGLDTGDPSTIHLDFHGRIKDIHSFPIAPSLNTYVLNPGGDDGPSDRYSGHGTHTSGSVLGDGSRAAALGLSPIQGMAPKAKLVFQAIEQTPQWTVQMKQYFLSQHKKPPVSGLYGIPDNLLDLFDAAYSKGARIHSDSWGGGKPGDYDNQAASVDRFVWEHRDFLVVIAAGNDGKESGASSTIELGSVTPPGTAKNCLTVGACENNRAADFTDEYGTWWPDDFPNNPLKTDSMTDSVDDVVAFSSRGPCKTKRRKPDVVAPGTYVLSTRSSQIPNNNFGWSAFPPAKDDYMYDGGTSMATPLVAGAAGLVRQYLRTKLNISKPSAALLKAALIHSAKYSKYRYADPSSRAWADNEQGWGRVGLASILAPTTPTKVLFYDENRQLNQSGDLQEFQINVSGGSVPLRVVMVYTDFPGEDLLNNLNLFVYAPDGQFHLGNDFQSTGTPDSLNNVEGVVVASPAAGTWRIRIVASEIQQGPQPFAIVISGAGVSEAAAVGAPSVTSKSKLSAVTFDRQPAKAPKQMMKKAAPKKAATQAPRKKRR